MVAHVRYSVTRRSGGRVTSCAICTVHMETRSACFLVEHQNQDRWFVSGLASKPQGRFLRFGHKIGGDVFSRFGLKTGGLGFPSLCIKIGSYGLVIWASKSP
jgi:hypothetical protein